MTVITSCLSYLNELKNSNNTITLSAMHVFKLHFFFEMTCHMVIMKQNIASQVVIERSGREGSLEKRVPHMHLYSCIIKGMAPKTFINKRHKSKKINSRSARRPIYPRMNRVPALTPFMMDWAAVLLNFMDF